MSSWPFKMFQLQKGSTRSGFQQAEVGSLAETEILEKIQPHNIVRQGLHMRDFITKPTLKKEY